MASVFAAISELSLASLAAVSASAAVLLSEGLRRVRRRPLDAVAVAIAGASLLAIGGGAYASRELARLYLARLGLNLPKVTLSAPAAHSGFAGVVELRALATDKPGTRGPIAAVRSVEFWLYHPSFAEQHPGNEESKVLLATVPGPEAGDEYAAAWACRNPYRPARDGDHGGGDGTRTYALPRDGRPYYVQAHALDDEFFAHPKRPGKSVRVVVGSDPCAPGTGIETVESDGGPAPGTSAAVQAATTDWHRAATADSHRGATADSHRATGAAAGSRGWRADWQTADGFALDVDSDGFRFPTSIAFVPRPGPGPKDPLYFVTELRGAIKVVANDRTVSVFADGFASYAPPAELPDMRGEAGLVSVCLDAQTGYVFASHVRTDERGALRNAITRFETAPGTFSSRPVRSRTIADVLGSFPSSRAHQIGAMVVHDRTLFVGVGDALDASAGARLDTLQGKILRMTLDGEPLPDNPFAATAGERAASADGERARRYVWSFGLRNPFGLVVAGGRLLAADNGPSVDRLLRVDRGRGYGFDGSDWSAGTNALAVFAPSVGPAQLAWPPSADDAFPPPYRGLYAAFGGSTQSRKGPGLRGEKSVVVLPLDGETGEALGAARPLLRYAGDGVQMPVGLAFGPDGLYVAPLFPMRDGRTAVLRLRWEPGRAHPFVIDGAEAPLAMLSSLGCVGCHTAYDGREPAGPSLEPRSLVRRVRERLSSPDYARQVAALDEARGDAAFAQHREWRRAVLEAEGREQVRLWLIYRTLEPRFDSPDAAMPSQGASQEQAARIAAWLVDRGWPNPGGGSAEAKTRGFAGFARAAKDALPEPRRRHAAYGFAWGAAAALALTWVTRRRP